MAARLDDTQMARRVAGEVSRAGLVALGPGLPGLVPGEVPPTAGVQFVSDTGALGYGPVSQPATTAGVLDSDGRPVGLRPGGTLLSLTDLAALCRGGHVDLAVVQAAQVSVRGDFVHWTTAATPDLLAPGTAFDLGNGPGRVIAMLPHTDTDGAPNLVAECSRPRDGVGCVSLIVTDLAVLRPDQGRLELLEAAPGWRVDDLRELTGAPLVAGPQVREMTFAVAGAAPASKVYRSGVEALHDLPDGAVVMIDGFAGPGGMPHYLLVSLRDHGARDLTIVSNTAGIARVINFGTPAGKMAIDHSLLIENRQVKKAIASYPVSPSASRPSAFELAYRRGEVELELVPQGTLAERLRAGGAGVAAFYTPTGVGTRIAEGKEIRVIDGKEYVLEQGLRADFCLIRGYRADTLGNVVYKGTSRNFNSVMAPAARATVVEVDEVVEPGQLDPEAIVTPGVFVRRVVRRPPDFSPYE